MATLLSRVTDFQPSTPIQSAQVDAEFNQLVELLSGSVAGNNKKALIKVSDAADPPLELDQIGAGPIAKFHQNTILRSKVSNDGSFETTRQFISTLASGTAPLVVASNTVVANLNADLLDGLNSSQFLRNDAAGSLSASDATSLLDVNQTGAGALARFRLSGVNKFVVANDGNLTISNNAPQITFSDQDNSKTARIALDNTTWFFIIDTPGSTPLSVNVADAVVTFQAIPVLPASDPTTANQAARKAYVDKGYRHLVADTTTNSVTNADLTSFTVPAGTLPTAGSRIRFEAGGNGMDNGETVTVQFNGVSIGSISQADTAANRDWRVDATIIRLTDTTVRCSVRATREHINYADGTVGETRTFNTDVTVNSLSGSGNVFKCVASGTITQNLLVGEVLQV